MKKERLVVMNGQKIVQVEEGEKDWRVEKVEKAHGVRPGYYNLYSAVPADKTEATDGVVLHVDGEGVYQLVGKQVVRHSVREFDKVPEYGAAASIQYQEGRAAVSTPQQVKRGKSR